MPNKNQTLPDDNDVLIGNLRFVPNQRRLFYKDDEVLLSDTAFDTFLYLAQHAGKAVSKQQLMDVAWPESEVHIPDDVELIVREVRLNVERPFNIVTIEKMRRRGYQFIYNGNSESE